MKFKDLETNELAFFAHLVRRAARDRHVDFHKSLKKIEIVEEGQYGKGRADVRLTIALSKSLEAEISTRWADREASLSDLGDTVEELVEAAERLFDDREDVTHMLRSVRTTLNREVAKANRRGLPYRALDVSLEPLHVGEDQILKVSIGLEMIGPLLRPTREQFHARSGEGVSELFAELRYEQENLLDLRDRLTRSGADFLVDAVMLAVLKEAGVCPERTVAELCGREFHETHVDVGHGRMWLQVRNGFVTGSTPLGDGMEWEGGRLKIPTGGTALEGVEGAPVRSILPLECFDSSAVIEKVQNRGDHAILHVQTQPVMLKLGGAREAA